MKIEFSTRKIYWDADSATYQTSTWPIYMCTLLRSPLSVAYIGAYIGAQFSRKITSSPPLIRKGASRRLWRCYNKLCNIHGRAGVVMWFTRFVVSPSICHSDRANGRLWDLLQPSLGLSVAMLVTNDRCGGGKITMAWKKKPPTKATEWKIFRH